MAAARQLDAADGARANGGPQISGDYRVVITQTCLRTPYQTPPATGFDPKTGQLMLDADAFTAIGSGLVQFAGDGSVQITEGTQTEVSVKQTAQGMNPITPMVQFTCNGTYTRQDTKVTLTLTCAIDSGQPGVTVSLGPQNFEGYIDGGNNTISMTNLAAGIQTITVSVGGSAVQQQQRICTQHALAVRADSDASAENRSTR